VTCFFGLSLAQNNPYLAKPGERAINIRIATCAVSVGFALLYTALENQLFEKYGFKMEHVFIRGSGPALAALYADEIQFLYCAADATLPSLASGVEVKLVAAPLVKLPYVLVTRKEIRRMEDLKGKSLGVARAEDLSDRLSRAMVKKFNVPDVTMRPIGGSQSERYQAMVANLVQGVVITPPLDVRARNDGFNITYRLIDMDIPFIYSSLHASSRMVRDRPDVVQRMVAGFAEAKTVSIDFTGGTLKAAKIAYKTLAWASTGASWTGAGGASRRPKFRSPAVTALPRQLVNDSLMTWKTVPRFSAITFSHAQAPFCGK
jgi:ABC-type nitrate/sulfonate/bicarbonate transport system substrate-binding protein